jgi:hypothetical protein
LVTRRCTPERWGWSVPPIGALIDRALADSSIVVTFDLDFGDILALDVLDNPSVIICRLAYERAESC